MLFVPVSPAVTVTVFPFFTSVHLPPLNCVWFVALTVRPPAENVIDGHDPVRPLTVPLKVIVAALSVAVYVWPAIVTVPKRCTPPFGAMDTPTLPLPLPATPDVTVIHDTPALDDQPQPAGAVTEIVAFPPFDGNVSDVRLSVYVHGGAAALSVAV